MFFLFFLLFFLAFVAMGVASGLVTRSIVKLGVVFRINEYLMGFFLLGVATSLPEFFIALSSIVTGTPTVSLGNIIGANIANITIVLGLIVYLSKDIEIRAVPSLRIIFISFLLTILPMALTIGGGIRRVDGSILAILFFMYIFIFSRKTPFFKKAKEQIPYKTEFFGDILSSIWKLGFGLFILFLSSVLMVIFGLEVTEYLKADTLNFSIIFMGLITTLPELLFGIRSSLLGHPELFMGNLLGSLVFNSTFILGIVAMFSPITKIVASSKILIFNFLMLCVSFIMLLIFSYTDGKIKRQEGILLISLYVLFFIIELITW